MEIEFSSGDDPVIRLNIVLDGAPVDLDATVEEMWFTVKQSAGQKDSDAAIALTYSGGGITFADQSELLGVAYARPTAEDTAEIPHGVYVADVRVRTVGGKIATVVYGERVRINNPITHDVG